MKKDPDLLNPEIVGAVAVLPVVSTCVSLEPDPPFESKRSTELPAAIAMYRTITTPDPPAPPYPDAFLAPPPPVFAAAFPVADADVVA